MIDNLGENGINRTTGKTLAPKTIGHYLSLTSAICADAAAKHLIKENPCRGIKLPKADHKERVIFTLEEAQTFLRALSQEPLVYQVFFVLAIYGGFRKGELLGLEWKDVDTDHRLISIRRAALFTHEDGHYIDTPKTEKSVRVLKLPAEVFPLLLQWKEQQQQERQACGDRWQVSDRIFTGTDGRPMGNSTPPPRAEPHL